MVDVPIYENLHLDNNIADGPGWSRAWNRHVRLLIEKTVLQKPAETWEQALIANGLPATAHRSSRVWLNAEETRSAGLIVDVKDPQFGMIRQIGVQTTLSSSPVELCQPAACRDVNIEEVLSQHVESINPVNSGVDGSSLLSGLRVLDLSNVLAGPVAGRTLAEYGAEVIKIDPPNPNFGPRISCMFPIEASPGKRSLLLDVKSRRGQKIFYELVKTADVVIHNFRPDVPKKMGIDYESIKCVKPNIIYLNISAFNGPLPGPWRNRAGFDPVLQAATGIQLRYGGEGLPPRYHGWASCIDYITGYSGAFGVALSLLRHKREKTDNAGDLVRTSLAQGAQLVQAPLLIGSEKNQPEEEVQGQGASGEHALYRFYQATDGWVFIAALPNESALLTRVKEFHDLSNRELGNDESTQTYLQRRLALKSVDHWLAVFKPSGIAVHRV